MYLRGIQVIDFSQYIPGPHTSLRLADMGAEVIKIEPRDGEPGRGLGISIDDAAPFEVNNQGKKSIQADLKNEAELQKVVALIKQADVVIESFRPGVMKKLGLGYEELSKVNPLLIYCSITGYGQTGKYIHHGSHDLNYMSVTGVLSQFKDDNGKPVHPTITAADIIGGITASEAIVAALFKREREGTGSYLDVALIDSLAALMSHHYYLHDKYGTKTGLSALTGKLVCYHIYETRDQRYVSLAALEPKFWEAFCWGAGHLDWLPAHFTKAQSTNPVYLEMQRFFKGKTFAEWRVFSEKIDCCLTPIYETNEARESNLLTERGLLFEDANQAIQTRTGYMRPSTVRSPSPALGEQNERLNQNERGG